MPEPFFDVGYDSEHKLWRGIMRFAAPVPSNIHFLEIIGPHAVICDETRRQAISCHAVSCHEVNNRVNEACQFPVEATTDSVGDCSYPRKVNINLSAYFESKDEAESEQTRELLAGYVAKVTEALS